MRGGGKINKTVVYREDLTLERCMSVDSEDSYKEYELYAVLVHYGPTIFSGHYVSFIKVDDSWYLFDDARVLFIFTYILFSI